MLDFQRIFDYSKVLEEVEDLRSRNNHGWDRKVESRLICLLGRGDSERGRKALEAIVRAMYGCAMWE